MPARSPRCARTRRAPGRWPRSSPAPTRWRPAGSTRRSSSSPSTCRSSTHALLGWLAAHPAPGAVVPRLDGVAQSLCARYSPADLRVAASLRADGQSAVRALLAAVPVTYVDETDWGAAVDAGEFVDVDTRDAVTRAGLAWPPPAAG